MQHYYYRPNRSKKRKSNNAFDFSKFSGLFKPFLIIVVLILLGFLLNLIYNSFKSSASNDSLSYLEVASYDGQVYFKNPKDKDFSAVTLDSVINVGASVQVRSDSGLTLLTPSRAEINVMPQSQLTYLGSEIADVQNENFKLTSGSIELDTKDTALVQLNVDLDYISIAASSFKGSLKSGLPIEVAVESGDALVNILDLETKSVYDSVLVPSNKKFSLDNQAYQKFLKLETPRVLTDYKPSVSTNKSELGLSSSIDQTEISASPVKITEPLNMSVQTEKRVIIRGTVPKDTEKVMVTSFESGSPAPYILKEYKPYSGTFIYYASYDGANGNIVLGKNMFEVKAIDDAGNESLAAKVEFIYKDATAQVTNDATKSAVDLPHKSSKLTVDEALSAPLLVSINDQPFVNEFPLKQSRGGIVGSVPSDAEIVVVNNFPLKFYKQGSGSFNYILSEKFKNLKIGPNTLEVYYVKNGKRSATAKFTINYSPESA